MTQRVLLHVGAPKTGTSYIQDVLFRHRDLLAERGVHYPADRHDAHFLAALDLMQLDWGGLEKQAVGAWDRLAEQTRALHGTVIISHEILAAASRAQVQRALDSLGDAEVHVVFSARDLARQIPAEWQENVKHRRVLPYARFLERLQEPSSDGPIPAWFWQVQDVPDVLDRWGHRLPPEHVHLVTVPPPGQRRELLWERFAAVFGLDGEVAAGLDLTPQRANASLGVPESALLRRVNQRVNDVVPNHHYREFVRELLAHHTLSLRADSPRLRLPAELTPWVDGLSRAWVTTLEGRGYDVVGDLADLLPAPVERGGEAADPDAPDEAQVADAAVDAIAALVAEAGRLREVEEQLHAEIADLRGQLDRAYLRPSYRMRQRVVRAAQDNAVGQKALAAYRRARGR